MNQIDAERQSRRTRLAIIAVVLLGSLYDLVVFLRYGGEATISTAVGDWLAAPGWGWVALVALGGLAGHFLAMMPLAAPFQVARLLAFTASAIAFYAITLLRG